LDQISIVLAYAVLQYADVSSDMECAYINTYWCNDCVRFIYECANFWTIL